MEDSKYFLDGNIFDFLLDKNVKIESLIKVGQFYTSIVQKSEVSATPDPERKEALLKIYNDLSQQQIAIELGILTNNMILTNDQVLIDKPSDFVFEYTSRSTNKPWMDALLTEVAKDNSLILVTNDVPMTKRATKLNIKVIDADTLVSLMNSND